MLGLYEFLRRAQGLVLPVHAASPAAGPAHAGFHFGKAFFDADLPGFRQLAGSNPANPFVASERADVLPEGQDFWLGSYSPGQVCWQFMHCAAK